MKILWVKAGNLLPANTGGRKRTCAMLREITRAGHHVHYLALIDRSSPPPPEEDSDSYAAVKEWVPHSPPAPRSAAFFASLAFNLACSSLPYALARYRSAAWQSRVAAAAASADLVVCDFLTPAPLFQRLTLPCPAVLFQHNIESEIWRRLADSASIPLKRACLRSQERRMFRAEQALSARFAGVITVSPDDSAFCRRRYHLANVLGDVPTGVDVASFLPRPRPPPSPVIGFLGSMDWMPNIEGVHWFVREVLPLIRLRLPDVKLSIIGRNPPASIRRLAAADPAITFTGTVPDVQPHVHQCSLIAVPLLAGGGTRIKIFEAMAMGVPVVSTTIGAEGLPLTPGRDLLLADDAAGFAAQTTLLLTSPDFAADLATAARLRAGQDFSWQSAAARFLDLCAPLLHP